MNRQPLIEIADLLRRSRRLLALSHIAPDGDAIGSLLGFGWLMRELNHPDLHLTLALADPLPVQFRWLPGATEIIADPPRQPWDVVVSLDSSDTRRLGAIFRPAEYGDVPVINLDHHVTNLYFGTVNYVDPSAAATAQVIVDLADVLMVPITRPMATCLLTGLVTDTLSFRTNNVDDRVLQTAIRLVKAGANLAEITQRSLNHKPLSIMRLWGLALSNLHLQDGVLWTAITPAMRAAAGVTDQGDGGLTSYLINAPEANIAAVFSERPDGQVEIGLRSRPSYDVSQIALDLGGGGHPQAAGCTIPGPLAVAQERVLPLLFQIAKDKK